MANEQAHLAAIVIRSEEELLKEWLALQNTGRPVSPADEKLAATASRDFLKLFRESLQSGKDIDLNDPAWAPVREFISGFTASRVRAGFTPVETATFIFSLKEPVFNRLRNSISDAGILGAEIWKTSLVLDKLGLAVTEAHQKFRDEIISRQQQELLELSTPVVRLWDNVLALPLIGTLDSSRTQIVMQNLLEAIVATRSDIAIIDITGVPTVDTLVAQHLLRTVAAARLMGADCIISGIRPQIAQTIIHLGVDLSEVTTKATMADAFLLALQRTGYSIINAKTAAAR